MITELVIASNNPHKVKEFERMLSPLGIKTISLTQAGVILLPEEDADTFEGNAYIKASSLYKLIGKPVVADDSGLCVDALNGAPGVYSARYGGEGLTDEDRRLKLLKEMSNLQKKDRTARFVCAISLIISPEKHFTFTGECEGKIGEAPAGENGFGYDPVFFVGEESFSSMSEVEKDTISHRGIALRKMLEFLRTIQVEQDVIG